MATEPNKIAYGGDMMIFIDSKPIGFSTDAKLEITADVREISSKDSGYWKEKSPGKLDWKASTDALYSEPLAGATTDFSALYAKMVARIPVPLVFAAKTGTSPDWTVDSAKKKFTGSAIIVGLNPSAPDNETTTYSISLEGTGELIMS